MRLFVAPPSEGLPQGTFPHFGTREIGDAGGIRKLPRDPPGERDDPRDEIRASTVKDGRTRRPFIGGIYHENEAHEDQGFESERANVCSKNA